MTVQLDLFGPITEPQLEQDMTKAQRFQAFHEANPHVLEALRTLALDMQQRGVQQWSIHALINVFRWQFAMHTSDANSEFKINNNYAPFYSRALEQVEPRLEGFFIQRKSEADEVELVL